MTRLNTKVSDTISFLTRFGLAVVWIVAGWQKLGKTMAEAQAIQGYEIFTIEWSIFLGRIIGPLELAGGVVLLVGIFLRSAAKISAMVLILFMIGVGQAWVRGLVIDCGCFGDVDLSDGGMDYLYTILRDVGLFLMSLWVMYRPYKRFAIHP
ncbi:Methylamine utilization protein MauE [Corynebacterium mustelae]|uniref:Methylamine utilization protein MauE n=1 Tax=Corynebacterium mustelae TaxID=571915 RepID=A0A0G3H0B2_9CORY|nr:DoxX family protein [Corynebacterium mustelae]AKK06841.1 Methylamine utilization protein MauE [Corynebacterium mustelae]